MKPFILLQQRPEDEASNNEYEAFLKFSGLKQSQLKRLRLEEGNAVELNLADYSGVMLGGGPYNSSEPDKKKSPQQKNFELVLADILDEIVQKDFPFLAACGIGVMIQRLGGLMSRKYGEPVGNIQVELTEDGKKDKLTKDLLAKFEALGGHKEACEKLPPGAVLLATSVNCPAQMLRVKQNIYLTQFHSELDKDGLIFRINVYKNAGYFPPEDADLLIERAKGYVITEPVKILRNFVTAYQS